MRYEYKIGYLEIKRGIEAIKKEIETFEVQLQINRIILKTMESELKNYNPPKLPPLDGKENPASG